ncbi:hypothetical protein [Gordonia iterans]|uniref:hypothetical protein n=1 Tax=Gordonia iterans TaxID=1004901 RepID=UPI00131D615B|nr:hypothetical protein [Gordonia iterans]
MQLRRLYFSAITLVAVFGLATVVMLPWLSLPGLGIGWNGIGRTSDTGLAESGFAPAARGWYVIAACAVAVLAACTLLRSSTKGTAPALWLAALCSAGGAAVPIVVLTDPDWFLGGLLREVGAVAYLDRGYDLLNVPVLSFCAGAMIVLTLLCGATALTVSPLRWRITITRTDASDSDAQDPDTPDTVEDDTDDQDREVGDTAGSETDEDETDGSVDDEDHASDDQADEDETENAPPVTRSGDSPPSG